MLKRKISFKVCVFVLLALFMVLPSVSHINSEGNTTSNLIKVDEANFPDTVFRNFILENVNIDQNGYTTQQELDTIEEIDLKSRGITSLKGIEHLTQLSNLYVQDNDIKSVDLSKNLNLYNLYIGDNDLTSIDVSAITGLGALSVADNEITTIDVSNNPNLYSLDVSNNHLDTINLDNNLGLTSLSISENYIQYIDVSKLTELTSLVCRRMNHKDYGGKGEGLEALDVSANTNLIQLDCADNDLSELDLSNNKELLHLYCQQNDFTHLDLSLNTDLESLNFSQNLLEHIDLSNNPNLTYLSCYQNFLLDLDISNQPNLTLLDCSRNQLTQLYTDHLNSIVPNTTHYRDQTRDARTYYEDGYWRVDASNFIDDSLLDRLTAETANTDYNPSTGIITFKDYSNEHIPPTQFKYLFDMEYNSTSQTEMNVQLNLFSKLPEMAIEKKVEDSDGDNLASSDEVLTYTITVSNNGDEVQKKLTVRDRMLDVMNLIDEDLDDVDVLISSTVQGDNNTTITGQELKEGYLVELVEPGEVITFTFEVTLKDLSNTSYSVIRNTAHAGRLMASAAIEIKDESTPTDDFFADKKVEDENKDNFAQKSEELTYRITVKNTTDIDINNVSVSDDLKDLSNYVTKSNKVDAVKVLLNGTINNSISFDDLKSGYLIETLRPNDEYIFEFVVTVNEDVDFDKVKKLDNTALINSTEVSASINTKEEVNPFIGDKTVTDENGDNVAAAKEKITYEISVKNTSKSTVSDIQVEDTLSNVLPYIKEELQDIEVSVSSNGAEVTRITGNDLASGYIINQLNPDEIVTLRFTVTVDDLVKFAKIPKLDNTAIINDNTYVATIPVQRASYQIIYDGNGHTLGDVPVDSTRYLEDEDIAIQCGKELRKDTDTFVNWNTRPDGSGKSFTSDEVIRCKQLFSIVHPELVTDKKLTLYAQWEGDNKEPEKPVTPDTPKANDKKNDGGVGTNDATNIMGLSLLLLLSGFAVYRKVKRQ
ncbi:hypothetical protein [Breznakia pachnodae]|uniref:Repeat protein (TIGR01451 family) n=1 Tax=Breznakia pachnodae TaxID=265178 RepID=A0ABU0E1K7_9FIRM|nr:hypothetical protein [Breznakia pachnodae]MDQ0360772.1 putative repeat protein (TIGR01451 family) [Breznakia pachnodae]